MRRRLVAFVALLGVLGLSAWAVATPRLTLINTARQVMPFTIYPNSLCLDAANQDACLVRGAADTLEQRRGLNPQIHNIYATYTDGSNFERLRIDTSTADIIYIVTEKSGTGSANQLRIGSVDDTLFQIYLNGVARWTVGNNADGYMFRPATDNTYDFGSSSNRARSGYFATGLVLGTTTFSPSTTTTTKIIDVVVTFSPTANAPTFAGLHVNPTFDGTTTGIGYGVVIASKTNDLRGGTIELLSVGTTTTDAFTGYSRFFALTNHGALLLGTSPSDSYVRAHFAAAVHAQTSFAVGAHVVTVANNTVGASANTEILSGYRSLYLVDCNDPDGCTMQLGTAGIEAGAITRIISITTSANTLTAASIASVQHVATSFTMGTNDVISLQFVRNRSGAGIWVENSRSNN